jgi:CBS domain-containing protein
MRAEDIMSKPVVTVLPETTVKEAAALLSSRGFTALPVVDDDDRLIGIITEADLMLGRIVRDPRSHMRRDHVAAPSARQSDTVGQIMTTPAVGMGRNTDAADLATVMLQDRIRSIPIVDGSTVVGIVTRRDLLRALARDDLAIAADVRRLLSAYGGERGCVVAVHEGAVQILDEFETDNERRVAVMLAQTVTGVQAVELTKKIKE